ncbi:MAG: hypothetical protein IPG17_10040 [Sandaracinaceae bacterium]|nr:hypothetical protein [Sandaracinaceae bacterium]MBP7684236.1 hypothetical protein [Deltaproteobacteria bacterium]MBK6810839.1 hypothetical protein [Sandaracinaceae bacterium]MBK7154547.1 hypothetical protein [Sandaracinaceae bacterium]MBK7775558.1 hypothetical protein [Sandaracinaceae bacterium]
MTDSRDDSSDSPTPDRDGAPSALRRQGSHALATGARGEGNVGMYAAAAGVMSALPIPFLDTLLASLARGAAMRRVAQRHGVRLEPAARDLLARGDDALRTEKGLRVVRSLIGRFVAPLRIWNRAEEALSAFSAAALLDHYLVTADRRPGAPLTEDEARRIQHAMKGAAGKGATDALKGMPMSTFVALKAAVDAARSADPEGRPAVERMVDALLDALADAPEGVTDAIRARFDEALSDGGSVTGPRGGV